MNYIPQRIYFAITNECNLRCLHCYRNSAMPHHNELTTSEIIAFFKYCSASLNPYLLTVTLTGGEPFLRHDIWDILDASLEFEINVDVATNGILLNMDMLKKLRDYPNLNMQMSVDGATKESVDTLRGPGVFEKTIEFLENINELKLYDDIDMNFVSVLTSLNYMEISKVVNLAKAYNISKVVFGECLPVGRASKHSDVVVLSPDKLKKTVESIAEIRKTEKDIVIVSQLYFDFLYDSSFSRANVCTAACGDVVCIGPSGDVTLCPAFSEDEQSFVGNIRNNDLIEIFNSSASQMFRLQAQPEANDCEHWDMCKGGCHILSDKTFSSNMECDPRCPIR